ncbi:DNA adenine methylase [Frateuria sp. YIM B11624]|uniref:DNA adenine methylase n=1 Tax=Frateuria sp. YIM B11624 TaxID=3143185 RepID=UPI003C751DFB
MRYPGGKGVCYQHLINLMPEHHTYIESHLGGGAVMRHKRPAARNIGIEIDRRVVERWREKGGVHFELVHEDALNYLAKFPFTGQELVYCDPPYMPSTRRGGPIYRHEYNQEGHERLLDALQSLPCMVMLSGYSSELYDTRLAGWRKHSFMAKTHTGLREETVWMNFPAPLVLHDPRYLGRTFRERQTIQRRTQTLHRRVTRMATTERAAFIRWMSEAFGEEFQEVLCK